MIRQCALTALILLAASPNGLDAFSPAIRRSDVSVVYSNNNAIISQLQLRTILAQDSSVPTTTRLSMTGDDGESSEAEENVEGEPEASADSEASSEEEAGEEEEETKESKEDLEVKALKEEIAELETTLKNKRSTLSYTQEQTEQYSKGGYARKVAEMENMRRMRSSMNSSSRSSATAGILAEFMPVYDKMIELKEKYADDAFGSKYGGVSLAPTLAKMGVKEYEISTGDMLNRIRMNPTESEYSTEFEKDTVIAVLSNGMELDGNVVRPANCVVSLGAPAPAEEETTTEEDEGEAEAAAEEESSEEEASQ